MFALGCIQARSCNANDCPAGVATQDPELVRGLVIPDKATRVSNFHEETVHAFMELLAAAGLDRPEQLTPNHIHRRVSQVKVESYAKIYKFLHPGQLIDGEAPPIYANWLQQASSKTFVPS